MKLLRHGRATLFQGARMTDSTDSDRLDELQRQKMKIEALSHRAYELRAEWDLAVAAVDGVTDRDGLVEAFTAILHGIEATP
jgi:hypothetical protein